MSLGVISTLSKSIDSTKADIACPPLSAQDTAKTLALSKLYWQCLYTTVLCLLLGKKATVVLLLGTNSLISSHMLFNDQQKAINKPNLANGAWAGNGRRSLCVNTQLLLQSIINHTVLQCVWQDSFAGPVRQTIQSDNHQLSSHRCHTVSSVLLTVWADLHA